MNKLFASFYYFAKKYNHYDSEGYAYMALSGLQTMNIIALLTILEAILKYRFSSFKIYALLFGLVLCMNYVLFLKEDKYKNIVEHYNSLKDNTISTYLAAGYIALSFLCMFGAGLIVRKVFGID